MMVRKMIPIHVHQLNGEIDPLRRGICFFRAQNVLLAQNGDIVFDYELCLAGAVGDHSTAQDQAFKRLQSEFKRHVLQPLL